MSEISDPIYTSCTKSFVTCSCFPYRGAAGLRFGCKRGYINQMCDLSEDLAVSTLVTCFLHL
ncbi:hypothetical protein HanRHA438_Chr05g0219691 [Helianthus annuus]|nr:hypothetical protein HanRHA438_Chr05g0219691 [Helianthus annuus]